MRFADEPAQRASSRQIARFATPAKRTTKGATGENSDLERLLGDVRWP
jgi:hypothetical protein